MRARTTRLHAAGTIAALALLVGPGAARATVLVDQPNDTGGFVISQDFPDVTPFSTFSLDDFTTTDAYNLTTLKVFGTELGNPAFNVLVGAQIGDGLPGPGTNVVMFSTSGFEDADGNLIIDFGGQTLAPGHYWLTAFVIRPFSGGGQWYWSMSQHVTSSEGFAFNPGGGFGLGSDPFPLAVFGGPPTDLAFQLQGTLAPTSAPEPSTLLSGTLAALVAGTVAWRRRRRPAETA